jgi:serine/threonine protein phosphatase 1
MGRVIAFGDIHGCSLALSSALHAIRPAQDDTLVMLGDTIDYGLDSRGVLDQLIDLEGSCRLVSLLGNHEEMMLSARQSQKAREFWLNCGGVATLESYGFGAQLAHIPARHWQFLERCLPFYETRTHLFVHANYRPYLPLIKQRGEMLRWRSLGDFLPGPHVSGKVAVVGHTPQTTGEVLNLGHLLCIDTCVQGGGWLTALDVTTGEIWQVDEQGQMVTSSNGLWEVEHGPQCNESHSLDYRSASSNSFQNRANS